MGRAGSKRWRSRVRRGAAGSLAVLAAAAASPAVTGAEAPGSDADRSLIESAALDVALDVGVPMASGGPSCPRPSLVVSWEEPDVSRFVVGGHLTPVGPAPTAETSSVSGVVLCASSLYAYLGFESFRSESGTWVVVPTPSFGPEEGEDAQPITDEVAIAGLVTSPSSAAAAASTFSWSSYGPVEPYPVYDPQDTCSPTVKPGTGMLRSHLLARYPGTSDMGIVRACHVGGTSEHKEGRAFDWGVDASSSQQALAADYVRHLMASDPSGKLHALARRMGVMYVIWNRQIWGGYRSDEGWRAYAGPNPHTDHVHTSLTRHGGRGDKSFWYAYGDFGSSAVWQLPVMPAMTDVSPFNIQFPEISYVAQKGIIRGTWNGPFYRKNPVTRAEIAIFLWRIAGSPAGPFPQAFHDVGSGTFGETAIEWMAAAGITRGYADGTYRPGALLTREILAEFLWRMSGRPAGPFSDPGLSDVAPGHPFATAIAWMIDHDIDLGTENGRFRPLDDVTRQTLAYNLYHWLVP